MTDYYDERYGLPSDFMRVPEGASVAASVRGGRMPELTANGIADRLRRSRKRSTCGRPPFVITAPTERWAAQAAETMTGFATSVIGCGCEAGAE